MPVEQFVLDTPRYYAFLTTFAVSATCFSAAMIVAAKTIAAMRGVRRHRASSGRGPLRLAPLGMRSTAAMTGRAR